MPISQEQYVAVVSSSVKKLAKPIFGLNSQGQFVFFNEYTTKHFGYSRNELLNMHVWDVDPSCLKEQFDSDWSLKQPSSVPTKSMHITKQGKKIPVSILRTYEKYGNLETCIMHVRDISKLEEQRNLLSDVINELPSPFTVKNYEGKFVLVNQALATLYGVEQPENMIGKDDGDYIPDPKQAEFFKRNVKQIMDLGETQTVYEDSYNAQTGERRHYMSIKKPFLNQKGEKHILVIANDITDTPKG